MALFDNFPYTNFHNLNLDWIIKVLKNAVSELEDIQTNWESVRDSANNAVEHATMAQTVADDAKKTANSAKTQADAANTKATTADEHAASALTTATDAKTTAQSAYNIAVAARQTATDANATAEAAEETANGFSSRIETAEQNASTAKITAAAADRDANSAVHMAEALQVSVNSIGDIAQQAHDLATTNEGDIASLDADVAQLNAASRSGFSANKIAFYPSNVTAYTITTDDINRGFKKIIFDLSENTDVLTFFDSYNESTNNVRLVKEISIYGDGYMGYKTPNESRYKCVAIVHSLPRSNDPYMIITYMLPPAMPPTTVTKYNTMYISRLLFSLVPIAIE